MKCFLAIPALLLALPMTVLHSQSAAALADGEICSDAVDTQTERGKTVPALVVIGERDSAVLPKRFG